ncbi:MAG: Na+:solute symporter [Gammaproteobacteria bacterium]|nr:Na+:solute symporter [Gammaproteobacteria bacterium]
MAGWDLLILLAFVAWSVTLGLRARRRASRGLDEYYLAGRQVRGFRAGISMAATQFAADTPLLFSGLIAVAGVFALWRLWVYGLAFLLMGFLFAAFWRRARILTDAELVEVRYSGRWRLPLRLTKAVYFGLVINSAVLGFVLLAMFQISELFFPWHAWLPEAPYAAIAGVVASLGIDISTGAAPYGSELASTNNLISIVLLLVFVGLYSTTGGLRGVIASDLLQFGLAMGGSIAFAVLLLWEVGGPAALVDRVVVLYGADNAARILSFTPSVEGALMPFLVIMGLQWLFQMNSDGTGYLAQRCMACASDRDARIAATVFAWVQILGRSLIWLVIGVGLLVLYPFTPDDSAHASFAASRERTFLAGIAEHLPVGVRGLMVTALVAALASTIDTHLNWGSSYLTNDVYKRFVCQSWLKREATGTELVFVARAASVLVLLAGCLVAANLDSIAQGWRISLLFGAGIGAVLILRWVWERINIQAEFAAMAIAIVAGPILLWVFPGDEMEWLRLGTMVLVSTAGTVLVALASRRTDPEVLLAFYRSVRPVGFWGRTACAAGDDPGVVRTALGATLLATVACAGSLFLALVGNAKLILPRPDEGFLLPILALLGAALLTPLWWQRLAQPQPPPA